MPTRGSTAGTRSCTCGAATRVSRILSPIHGPQLVESANENAPVRDHVEDGAKLASLPESACGHAVYGVEQRRYAVRDGAEFGVCRHVGERGRTEQDARVPCAESDRDGVPGRCQRSERVGRVDATAYRSDWERRERCSRPFEARERLIRTWPWLRVPRGQYVSRAKAPRWRMRPDRSTERESSPYGLLFGEYARGNGRESAETDEEGEALRCQRAVQRAGVSVIVCVGA